MRFKDIEINGIINIVIAHKVKWTQLSSGVWQKQIPDGIIDDGFGGGVYTHEQMMEMVNHLKGDRRYRMWVHWDTLNILKVKP